MAASFAWLSVSVHRRLAVVVNRKIVQCAWCDTFAEVLEQCWWYWEVYLCMQKESFLVYDVTGNYLPLISSNFQATYDPLRKCKRSINLKWPNGSYAHAEVWVAVSSSETGSRKAWPWSKTIQSKRMPSQLERVTHFSVNQIYLTVDYCHNFRICYYRILLTLWLCVYVGTSPKDHTRTIFWNVRKPEIMCYPSPLG